MGSTPHAHAQANVKNPHQQGVVAMIGVFIDTFVVLTLNALVIISTLYTEGGPLATAAARLRRRTCSRRPTLPRPPSASSSARARARCSSRSACSSSLSPPSSAGTSSARSTWLISSVKRSTVVYTVIALVFIFLGTLTSSDLVWELSDMFNNLMVIPNAIALFALTGLVVKHVNGTPEADRWE